MKDICFVIQPFNEKFNKRYHDIIKPTIENCGLMPYRVDEDASVLIPIESIEENIRKASICVAEITTNNPNVWYEVGYAMAAQIPVILLCSDERTEQYPFDVRHRNILQYKTLSLGDYEEFGRRLEQRILKIAGNTADCNSSLEQLTDEEYEVIMLIAQSQVIPDQLIAQRDLENSKMTKGEFVLALRRLISAGVVKYVYAIENGQTSCFYQLTQEAEKWLLYRKKKIDSSMGIKRADER